MTVFAINRGAITEAIIMRSNCLAFGCFTRDDTSIIGIANRVAYAITSEIARMRVHVR
jgi:hypothetical protein